MSQNPETLTYDYDTDSKQAGWDSPERVQKLVESRVTAGSKVLDIGIGTGLAVSGYADKGATVIGLDHDQAMLDTAQTVVGEHGSLRQADINKELPIADLENSVDVAQAVGVLEFAKDLPSVFGQVYSTLKEDGMFAFTSELIDGVQTTEPETHYDDIDVTVYRRTPYEMADLLEQAGFQLVHVESYDGYERGGSAVPYGIFLAQK
ncbi:MAG TPA: class I SAM-dependent methyltransferase [Candidatus Saccharibacteria bacterium]|nr:class I SAM-dependent methyltransferase [Candidatus Saccharibacteria bacterium]